MRVVQTEGLVAGFAVKVTVQFLDAADMVVAADAVFGGAAAVFEEMHQMVFGEQGQCSEKGGFVHAVQHLFQIGHAERVVETVHRFVYEYPDRCGADTVAVQYLVGSCLSVVHGMVCFRQIWRKIRHILRPGRFFGFGCSFRRAVERRIL